MADPILYDGIRMGFTNLWIDWIKTFRDFSPSKW